MVDNTDDTERRVNERVDLEKMMFLQVGDETIMGLLKDVSHSGAKFVFDDAKASTESISAGSDGLIVIDGIGEISGNITRIDDGAVVFAFDVSGHAQDEIIANIMIAQNEIDMKPDE